MKIILASGSPRRRQLMQMVGLEFEVVVSDVDETITGAPDFQVKALAQRKALATIEMLQNLTEQNFIVAADTLVYVDDEVLGKPVDENDARNMLMKLSGRAHRVYTGVSILVAGGENEVVEFSTFVESAEVFFRKLSPADIDDYIATGEPFDKAGAYGIQERGATLVDRVNGDFYTVVGLPIAKVYAELKRLGADLSVAGGKA